MKIINTKTTQKTIKPKMQTKLNINWIKPQLWIIILLASVLLGTSYQTKAQADTVIVEFGDSSKVVAYVQNAQDAKAMQKLDWNLIMTRTVGYLNEAHKNHEEGTQKKIEIEADEDDKKQRKTISIGTDGIKVEYEDDDDEDDNDKRRRRSRTRGDFYLDFGLNNYFENGEFGNTPTGENYELRSWGSRYVAFGPSFKTQLGGRKSPFLIQYGIEASWNNFMFSGNDYIIETENGVDYPEFNTSLDKTKLTVAYINLPLMFHLDFANRGRNNLKAAFGGYAGYRVGSYTKQVYRQDGDRRKDRNHGNYFLNDWRYGVRAELGIGEDRFSNGLRLFFTYDLNPLFEQNAAAPELNAFTFGIRI